MWEISVTGVIFLKRLRTFSKHEGMYLSNRMIRLVFSAACSPVSNQLVTYLKPCGNSQRRIVTAKIYSADVDLRIPTEILRVDVQNAGT